MKPGLLFLTVALLAAEAPVPGFPIGRCVRVAGVTAPEDAVKAGFEYVELALQDILPLSEEEFERTVARIRGLGIPAISGYEASAALLRQADRAKRNKEQKNATQVKPVL